MEICHNCGMELHFPLASGAHSQLACIERQLSNSQLEIKKLKDSVDAWKNSWFLLRDLIGTLSWQHLNCPHQIKTPQG